MKIPLIRPYMPPMREITRIYSKAYKSGIHSNFGPLFNEAVSFLNEKTNRHCLPVSTGTDAIEIACRMQFKPGDRILVPDYTHIGTIVAIKASGCIPVLCDTNESWVIDADSIYRHRADGVVAVSPFGRESDVWPIDDACRKFGIKVVYDFAGAWGSFPITKNPVCYSLHATKNFSCGEGGVISFATKKEWLTGRHLSNFCNDPDRIVRSLDGRNHKPSELLCAVILAHDKGYDKNVIEKGRRKKQLRVYYNYSIKRDKRDGPSRWDSESLCVVGGITKEQERYAKSKGVEIKQYYTPIPVYLTEHYSRTPLREVLSRYALPSDVTDKEAKQVVRILNECKKKS